MIRLLDPSHTIALDGGFVVCALWLDGDPDACNATAAEVAAILQRDCDTTTVHVHDSTGAQVAEIGGRDG